LSVTNEDTTILAYFPSTWLRRVPASTPTWAVARTRSLNRHVTCDSTDLICCNTRVPFRYDIPFLVTSRYFYVGLVRPRVSWQTCHHQHALGIDTLILCFSLFRYVSSSSPIINVKRAVVWRPCREENWPCTSTRFITKRTVDLDMRDPTGFVHWFGGAVVRCLLLEMLQAFATGVFGNRRLLRVFAHHPPAFVGCPPTSSTSHFAGSIGEVKGGEVCRITWRII